jgi:hypothetical protein
MGLRRGALVLSFLFLSTASIAQLQATQSPTRTLTLSEYVAELDRLASVDKQLAHPEDVPKLLDSIPSVWQIQTPRETFYVSSTWLLRELNEWQRKPDREIQERIFSRLQILRSEAVAFGKPVTDVSQKRALLNGILAGREFQDIHGPTWLDQLKQRILELLVNLLGRVFQSSSIPTIGNAIIYGLIALAILAVAYWMYRTIRSNTGVETILPHSSPISSKGWKLWMNDARLAADRGNWRDAIHLGYWCGISFLEAQGLWRPDTARTPREYLRLMPTASEHCETLSSLTRTFELVWYGTQEADANAFVETLAQLEKLGCQSN